MSITAELASELLKRQKNEQIELHKLENNIADADPEKWAYICKENLNFINNLVKEHGWPRADLFEDEELGSVVEYAAWICVQHGDFNNMHIARAIGNNWDDAEIIAKFRSDPLFIELENTIILQEECLRIMERDGAAKHHIAFVTDRVARNKEEPQSYRTQYVANPLSPKMLDEIVEPEKLELRRAAMGLDSYAEHKTHLDNAKSGLTPVIMTLPPVIRENSAIMKYKTSPEVKIQNIQLKPNKKILIYDFNRNLGLEEFAKTINLAGYEIEIFYPDSPHHLAQKLLNSVADPAYEVIANFSGGTGEYLETLNRINLAVDSGDYGPLSRNNLRFLSFSDSDRIGRFFSFAGVGQAFLVGPTYQFNREKFPENHAALMNILDQRQQNEFEVSLQAINRSAETQQGEIEGIISGGDTESIMQNRGGALRDIELQKANILFIENPNGLDEIERLVKHLKSNQLLDNYNSIVLSSFTGESTHTSRGDLEALFAQYDVNIPVFYGYPQGHRFRGGLPEYGTNFIPLPLHTYCTISCSESGVKMQMNPKANSIELISDIVRERSKYADFVDVDLSEIASEYQAIREGHKITVPLDNPFLRDDIPRLSNIAAARNKLQDIREKPDLAIILPDLSQAPYEAPAEGYGEIYYTMVRQALHGFNGTGSLAKIANVNFVINKDDRKFSQIVAERVAVDFPGVNFSVIINTEATHPLSQKWQKMKKRKLDRNALISEFYNNLPAQDIRFAEEGGKLGIMAASQFFGAEYFVGEFDERNLPLRGEFVFPNNLHIKIAPNADGTLHARQLDPESNLVQNFSFHFGKDIGDIQDLKLLDKEVRVVAAQIDKETSLDLVNIATQIKREYKPREINLGESSVKIQNLKARLDQEEPAISVTMHAEYGLRNSKEANEQNMLLDRKISALRQGDIETLLASGLGNCREFACKTQRIAKSEGIDEAFVIAACPNHIFNIIVDEGKAYIVDSWDKNNVFAFTAENFYRQANLHGLANFRIFERATYKDESKSFGIARREALELTRKIVEAQIQEVKQAAFEPEYNAIIADRVRIKIDELDPNNYYFHEHARELLYLIDYYDLGLDLKARLQEGYIQKFDPNINAELTALNPHIIYDLFCHDSANPHENYQNISQQIIAKLSVTQEELSKNFRQYDKGLDPNSDLIISYINSSYSRDKWANIHQEIEGFADLVNDQNLPFMQRIDAEGYYAICKFKIAGDLFRLSPEDRRVKIDAIRGVLEKHFGLSGDINFAQILSHTEDYARSLVAKQQGEFKTAAESSRMCQAAAILMQMPTIGGKCDDFAEIAKKHFKAAQNSANMESARGCTFLSTAYEWLQNPAIPYKEAVSHLVSVMEGKDFHGFCQEQENFYTAEAARLGSISAIGSLGKQAKKNGEYQQAEQQLKKAADSAMSRFQYLLGELYLEQDRNIEAEKYLSRAEENNFPVNESLTKKSLTRPTASSDKDLLLAKIPQKDLNLLKNATTNSTPTKEEPKQNWQNKISPKNQPKDPTPSKK